MASSASTKVVLAALVGNSLIAVLKFAAAGVTGSSAMFSEAVHSVVDSFNQVLLLYGMWRAKRPADARHPFGYAREVYFWAFVVAILIFSVGAGVSFYEGVQKLLHPHPITDPIVNYLVLALAMVFEGGSWWIALREFRATKGRRSYLQQFRHSKDPTIFVVLFEDSAALVGLAVAFIGIALAEALGVAWLDGAASILIGAVLAVTAAFLAYESKGLLIGEGASRAVTAGVRKIVKAEPGIARMNEMLTMHLGPTDVLLNLSVDFRDGISSQKVESAISRLESEIKSAHPEITRVFIEAQSWRGHKASKRKRN